MTITTPPPAPHVQIAPTSVPSSSGTASNANASATDVATSTGVVVGRLSINFEVADIPLAGPGVWLLITSVPTIQTLHCGALESPVSNRIVVGARQSCQFEIGLAAGTTQATWRLSPNA